MSKIYLTEAAKRDASLQEVNQRLERIEDLLKRLPEIQAAVFLQMLEEAEAARLQGRKIADLWVIAPPDQR